MTYAFFRRQYSIYIGTLEPPFISLSISNFEQIIHDVPEIHMHLRLWDRLSERRNWILSFSIHGQKCPYEG